MTLLLAFSFTIPLILGAWLRCSQSQSPGTAWLRNATLSGVQNKTKSVRFTFREVRSAQYQTDFAHRYDADFPARELLIRLTNEFYLRVFRMSSGSVVVGPGHYLHERTYLEDYVFLRHDKEVFRPFVRALRRLQDFCDARKIAFALLISPSKASVLPETIPASWLRRYRPGSRSYDSLLAVMREEKIHFVDGHRITAEMKKAGGPPVFPSGGVHWGDPAALATANALLELFAGEGLDVETIKKYETEITDRPAGQDIDLAQLVNTLFQPRYPVAKIDILPAEAASGRCRPNLVTVGGSFTDKVLRMFGTSHQFSEINFYSYYKSSKNCIVDGENYRLAEPASATSFESDVFAADSLLLELNEEMMYRPTHIINFLQDALCVLPDPYAAKAPFHSESCFKYQWGDILSFDQDKCPVRMLMTSGFAPPGPGGAMTEKPVAAMRFDTPPAAEDVTLEVVAWPYLGSGKILQQRMNVSVNGQMVGELTWRADRFTKRTLKIPKSILSGSETRLEFQMQDAAAPSALGEGKDNRHLGLCIASVRMQPDAKASVEPAAAANGNSPARENLLNYHWSETIRLRDKNFAGVSGMKNFTLPGGEGSFTVGPAASLRMLSAPATQDMLLSVYSHAFLAGSRLDRQTADVYVNRHPVARWVWPNTMPGPHTVVVPKDFLSGSEIEMEFRIERPTSPAELGLGVDDRKLGICISGLRFQPVVR